MAHQWNNEDARGLRDYLATASGQNFLENLRSTYILLGGNKSFEEGSLKAEYRAGQESMVNHIIENSEHDDKPDIQTNSYVDTDDSPR